jgi:TIR domain-containing protein
MASIFISYRRGDTAGHAGRLSDGLTAQFGEGTVFMDLEAIMPGVDYEERIRQAVGSCDVALILIGDEWLTMTTADGGRRIDDPGDFVRLEVASALARDDLEVVPVLVEEAEMPSPRELPDDIARLSRINAIELTDQRWRYDLGRLVDAIRPALGETTAARRRWPAWWKIAGPVAAVAVAAAAVLAVTGGSSKKHPSSECPPAGLADQKGPPTLDQLNALQTAIVPGRSLGPVSLGQTAGQVEQALKFLGGGRLGEGNPCTGRGQLYWDLVKGPRGLSVNFDAGGHADQLVDTSALFRLGNASLYSGIAGLQRDLGPSWKRVDCSGFSLLYRNESSAGPATIWRMGTRQGNLELRSFSFPGDNAPCQPL